MEIAVYSGSFNPLHKGHQAIMEYLTLEMDFDWVYLVVSPQNPFKEASNNLSARERYLAAIEAVKRHPSIKVWVDDIELTLPPPQYTIRTLDALKRREPENNFTLVIGADNLSGIRGWRDAPRILSDYGVAVYPRSGYDMQAIRDNLIEDCRRNPSPYVLDKYSAPSPGHMSLEETLRGLYRIQLLEDAPVVDISSTRIREGIARGEDMSAWMM